MSDTERYRELLTADEVDRFISDEALNGALDWFDGEPRMSTEEYLDRLFPRYGGIVDDEGATLDLDQLDNEAARRIMSRARSLRRERDS